jgi:hypothetical protein
MDTLNPPGPSGDRRALLSPFAPPPKPQSDLADVLQRVLDTGVVLVGDVGLVINGTEILSLRVRLLVASIDKSEEVGLDWWRHEPAFSSVARKQDAKRKALRRPPPRPSRRLARPHPARSVQQAPHFCPKETPNGEEPPAE